MKIIELLIEHHNYSLNRPFSYYYLGNKKVDRGFRVLVTFNHQELVGRGAWRATVHGVVSQT